MIDQEGGQGKPMAAVSLTTFEDAIDSAIVRRGADYFGRNRVQDFQELDEDVFSATVEGSEPYTVRLTLRTGGVQEHLCDCPYDLGEYCKHEVALLYAVRHYHQQLQEGTWTGELRPPAKSFRRGSDGQKKERKPAQGRPATIARRLKATLQHLNFDQLKELVSTYAGRDRAFRAYMLSFEPVHADVVPIQLRKVYKERLEEGICVHADQGFVDYKASYPVARVMYDLLRQAEDLLRQGQSVQALAMVQAVVETWVEWSPGVDDSNGEFGGCLQEAWQMLAKMVESIDPASPSAEQVFYWCLQQLTEPIYTNNDAMDIMFQVLMRLVYAPQREKELIRKLVEFATFETGPDDDIYHQQYLSEKSTLWRIELARHRGQTQEVRQLLQKNLCYSSIREDYLELLLQENNLAEAKKVARAGVRQAKKDRFPGLVDRFNQLLQTIAEREGDTDTSRELLTQLFIKDGDFDVYEKLKASYADNVDEWQQVYARLVETIQGAKPSCSPKILFALYQKEEQWTAFRDLFIRYYGSVSMDRDDAVLALLESYQKPMQQHFFEELIELYYKAVWVFLRHACGRADYKKACRALRRMRKMGAVDRVNQLCQRIRETYPAHRALLDELSRV